MSERDLPPPSPPDAHQVWGENPGQIFSEVIEVDRVDRADPTSSREEIEEAILKYYSGNPEIEKKAKSQKLDVLAKTTPKKILFYLGPIIATAAAVFGARVLYNHYKEKNAQKKE